MISIIIPVYNQADKLAKCLTSILAQTYRNFEVIIVNDGSTDEPKNVFTEFEHQFGAKIKYLSQVNQGANVARNNGAKEVTGEFLFFCDADIVLTPECLAKLLTLLEANPTKAYAYSSFIYAGKLFKVGEFSGYKLKQGPMIHTSALLKASAFPGFDESLKRFQDWDLWLTILERGDEGIWIDEVLFEISGGGTMSDWLPSWAYKYLSFLPAVKRYQEKLAVVKSKHSL